MFVEREGFRTEGDEHPEAPPVALSAAKADILPMSICRIV
jgi:hypothetical protein